MISPFRFGGEVTAIELVDRVEEVALVERVLASKERLFLIGPRRFGKTSILSVATERARGNGVRVISVNAEEFVSSEALAAELIRQGTEQLTGSVERGIVKAAKFFRNLKPTVAYDPLLDHWSVGISPDKSSGLQTKAVTEALNGLDALAASGSTPVAVIIDEFQQVVSGDGISGERALRAVVQRHQNLAYVFAGSATTLLTAMTSDHNRPFYRLGSKHFLGPVPRPDFLQHLQSGFAAIGVAVQAEAATRVLDISEDVPYSVQRLAHEAWTACLSDSSKILTHDAVEAALSRLIATETPQFGRTVAQLTSPQLKSLVAVAEPIGGYILTATETAKKFSLAVSTLRRALNSLEDKGLLRQDFGLPGEVRWCYEDPFFKAYVRRSLRV